MATIRKHCKRRTRLIQTVSLNVTWWRFSFPTGSEEASWFWLLLGTEMFGFDEVRKGDGGLNFVRKGGFLVLEKISLKLAIRGVGFKPSWWGSTQCHDHCIQGTSGTSTFLRIFLIAGCQEPGKICRMYEGAVAKEPNNEEFLTHLFMSYVRLVMILWFVFTHLFAGWESTKSKKRQPEIFTK